MDIEEIVVAKDEMAKRIQVNISNEFNQFKSLTGITPSWISVQLVPLNHFGCILTEYLVGEVKLEVKL